MGGRRLGWLVGLGLAGAAVARELRRPPADREWRGRLSGLVPYDLRPPPAERMRLAWWNPTAPLFPGQPFGVGWTVNVGRVGRLLRARVSR